MTIASYVVTRMRSVRIVAKSVRTRARSGTTSQAGSAGRISVSVARISATFVGMSAIVGATAGIGAGMSAISVRTVGTRSSRSNRVIPSEARNREHPERGLSPLSVGLRFLDFAPSALRSE